MTRQECIAWTDKRRELRERLERKEKQDTSQPKYSIQDYWKQEFKL